MKTAESQLINTFRLANRFSTLPQAGLVGKLRNREAHCINTTPVATREKGLINFKSLFNYLFNSFRSESVSVRTILEPNIHLSSRILRRVAIFQGLVSRKVF